MNQVTAILKNNVPFRRQLRALKRAMVPYTSDPANDKGVLATAIRIVAAMHDLGGTVTGSTVVEIGSGWVPITPLMFRVAGASEIITVDQDRLMDRNTFQHAVNYIRDNFPARLAEEGQPAELFDLRRLPHHTHQTFAELRDAAGLTYLAPSDFLELPIGIADFIISRSVLEHISEDDLRRILTHAASVIKPGGIMCNAIDLSDHFEHKDKSLSRVDMLRYSDKEWRAKTRDPQYFNNRLRRFDFVRLHEETGWEILKMDGTPDPKALQDIKGMKLMERYANTPHEELAILVSTIYARRKA